MCYYVYIRLLLQLISFSYVLLNIAIDLSITFHWHGISLLEERGQYHRSDGFRLARGTSDKLIAM